MDELSVAFGKIILATLSIPIPEDPVEVLELAKNQTFFMRKTVNRREKVIIHGDDVAAIFDLLYERDHATPPPLTYHEGMEVAATFNGELKQGKIKKVTYQVEGCGKKHYKASEIEPVE